MKQSAGQINVTSEVGAGTTFRILVPCVDATAESTGAAVTSAEPAQPAQGVVLLVEDEDQLRVLLRNVLRRAGYEVLEAATPGEAILVVEQHQGPIDLLLTDVVMPRMDGRTLALGSERSGPR